MKYLKIPMERVGVLIGQKGETKRNLEEPILFISEDSRWDGQIFSGRAMWVPDKGMCKGGEGAI